MPSHHMFAERLGKQPSSEIHTYRDANAPLSFRQWKSIARGRPNVLALFVTQGTRPNELQRNMSHIAHFDLEYEFLHKELNS